MTKLLATDGEGERLDRFELITELASGGMATVYLARLSGVAGFQRLVAIKRLHPHLAKEADFVEMFLDEARLAARIHHPNVVPIQEVGESRGYYLVMDYVEGDTLARLLARSAQSNTPIPWNVATRIMLDSLAGLHAAHELRDDLGQPLAIVHRDVSPQNILLGSDGVARITDFGVARAASRLSTTRSGQLKGKLAYMAPEQARGDAVDRRADLFALGIVFWETLALKRLFKGDGEAATLNRVLHDAIAPPSTVRPDIPKALEDVCMKALQRDPAERYASALDFADDLERVARELSCVGSVRDVAACLQTVFGADLTQQRDAVRAWLARSEPNSAMHSRPGHPESSPTRVDASKSQHPPGAAGDFATASASVPSPSHPPEKVSSLSSAVFSGIEAQPPVAPRRSPARALVIMAVSGVLLGIAAWGASHLQVAPATTPAQGAHEVAPPVSVPPAPRPEPSVAPAEPSATAQPAAAESAARPTARPVFTGRRAPSPAPAPRPATTGTVPDDLSKNPYR